GPEMKYLFEALSGKYESSALHYYEKDHMDRMINDLKEDIKPHDIVMLKGSHGMHLEKVLERLL
ncbi:MAG: UDP-N-acetylmuramoyl-tripeptide--D-alanyl-D-alanine ligase, partial [Lactobacillus iners]|nr:UDP-N-acetylmuramoyl-tripeptide--D-alanyl-D-alanine ligase [Lactobacillus iners]